MSPKTTPVAISASLPMLVCDPVGTDDTVSRRGTEAGLATGGIPDLRSDELSVFTAVRVAADWWRPGELNLPERAQPTPLPPALATVDGHSRRSDCVSSPAGRVEFEHAGED